MSTINRHLSLILPLFGLLFSLQSLFWVNRAIIFKEKSLAQNYSIIIAAKAPLTLQDLRAVPGIFEISPLDPEKLLQKFKDFDENLSEIKAALPKFYTLKLKNFPQKNDLEKISKILAKTPSIVSFETFSKSHDQVYGLLLFIKKMIGFFAILLFALSFLLILRVVQIWGFLHHKRMEIMGLLGASFWLKNKELFWIAIIDSLIATIAISVFTIIFSSQNFIHEILKTLGISREIFSFFSDFATLVCTAFGISFLCVFMAILTRRGR